MVASVLDWIRAHPTGMIIGVVWALASALVVVLYSAARAFDGRGGLDRLGLDDEQMQAIRLENAARRERLADVDLADDRGRNVRPLPGRSRFEEADTGSLTKVGTYLARERSDTMMTFGDQARAKRNEGC